MRAELNTIMTAVSSAENCQLLLLGPAEKRYWRNGIVSLRRERRRLLPPCPACANGVFRNVMFPGIDIRARFERPCPSIFGTRLFGKKWQKMRRLNELSLMPPNYRWRWAILNYCALLNISLI